MRSSATLAILFAGAVTQALPMYGGGYGGGHAPPALPIYGGGLAPPAHLSVSLPKYALPGMGGYIPTGSYAPAPPMAPYVPALPVAPYVPALPPVETLPAPPTETEVPPPVETLPAPPTEAEVPPVETLPAPPTVPVTPIVPEIPTSEAPYEVSEPEYPEEESKPEPEYSDEPSSKKGRKGRKHAEAPYESTSEYAEEPSEPEYAEEPSEPEYAEKPSEPEYSEKPSEPEYNEKPSEPEYSGAKGPKRLPKNANFECRVSSTGFEPKEMSVTKGDIVKFIVSVGGKIGIRHGDDASACVPLETGAQVTPEGGDRILEYIVPENASEGPLYFYNVEGDQCTASDMSATLNVASNFAASPPTTKLTSSASAAGPSTPAAGQVSSAASHLPMLALVSALSCLATLLQF